MLEFYLPVHFELDNAFQCLCLPVSVQVDVVDVEHAVVFFQDLPKARRGWAPCGS